MVEVTKLNFDELILPIEKAIHDASFIAIDTEFTGLNLGLKNEARLFDSLEERYQKLRSRATSFVPCQIGVSIFTRHGNENRYSAETYVFFIRPYLCGKSDRRFMFQASCLDFLNKYDFDFNKFIKEGIPYLNEVEVLQMTKELKEGTFSYSHEKLLDLRPQREQDVLINESLIKSLQSPTTANSESVATNQITLPKIKMCHEYFQLSELRRKYPTLWAYAKDDSIILEVVTPERRKELEETIKDEEKMVLDHYLGFTKLFRILKDAKKPIIGHNLLMDLLLFFHNFHRPLPETYVDFKKELHNIFPVIFDTRYIWLNVRRVYKFKDLPKVAGLFDLYEAFKNPTDELCTLYSPDVFHNNNDKYLTGEFPHESGYDSFVTGWVFLKVCHLLAMKKISNPIHVQSQTFKKHLDAVEPFTNKLNVGRLRERYINIGGTDPLPAASFLHISHKNASILHQKELSRILDKYPNVEIKLARNRKSGIMAVGGVGTFREIIRDFKHDPEFIITKYHSLKHSVLFTSLIWASALGTGCLVAYLISRSLKK